MSSITFQFGYDPVGNVTSLTNAAQPPATNSIGGPESKTFVYDDLYRLKSSAGTHTIASGATFKYTFSQSYDSIHNITHKTQSATQNGAVNPQTTYDFAYTYPAPGSAHPHGPTAIGPFTIANDADGNQVNTLGTGTSDQSQYLYDEENRLSCANKGPQAPSPSCHAQGNTSFIYDHDGVRKVKTQSTPTIYPNQHYTDFGDGSGNQFKHIFIGSERTIAFDPSRLLQSLPMRIVILDRKAISPCNEGGHTLRPITTWHSADGLEWSDSR